jgi:CubicO group peptidase (beta-lactamase class C family)
VTAVALWVLAERGLFGFSDRIADHVPEFKKHAKGNITVLQTITHQAGFPNAVVGKDAWADHKRLREVVCDFPLEFTPGSKVHYHGLTAHWTLGVLIEAVTGKDFRDVIRETVTEPLGLSRELYVGLPESEFGRAADMHEPKAKGDGFQPSADANAADWRKAGAPGGAGYGTARAMAALYQMMLNGGELNGTRLVSPRMLQYALRNHTGDRVDEFMGMPMHRGLGPHLRGTTENVRGLGGFASPRAFGHGGVGTSYCWGDPDSGVSFAYISNNRIPDPWHSKRLDLVANFVHSAIL